MNVNCENTISSMIESFIESNADITAHKRDDSIFAKLNALAVLESMDCSNTMQEISNNHHTKQLVKNINEYFTSEMDFKWPYTVCPYFTPIEIKQLRGYYTDTPVSEGTQYEPKSWHHRIEDLKEELKHASKPEDVERIKQSLADLGYDAENDEFNFNLNEATGTQFNPKTWTKKVRDLELRLKTCEDEEEISKIKQDMVNLGWNPEIEFTEENMILARNRFSRIYQEKYCNTISLDIRPLVENYKEDEVIQEANTKEKIYPIHIILVKGNSVLSDVIQKTTHGEFSHSALCIDNDFSRLYSFNMDNQMNFTGGFSLESIKRYPQDNRLAIFTFFVKESDYKKIEERIQILLNGIKGTTYSILNILTFQFKRINLNMPTNMICSQFVDSILKMVNSDITGKNSAKVDPNFLYTSSVKNAKIYKVFDGYTKDFDPIKTEKYVKKMSRSARPFNVNETSTMHLLNDFIYPVVLEARQFPFQINKDGDILLTNHFVDFDSEYSASHKLLIQYEKANNYEAMKYELARLYYMNYILEKRLYHNKYLKFKEKNKRTRARVLNDFNKYLALILKHEPEFNFSKYYEESPFYAHTIEVKSSTVYKMKDLLDYIL